MLNLAVEPSYLDAVDKGAQVTLVVLSKGEAGSSRAIGATRVVEAQYAANLLGANLHFVETGGDTRIQSETSNLTLTSGPMKFAD